MPDRILIVDDDQQIRDLVRSLLNRNGYECVAGASARHASALLARENFTLLLADLQMPGESGLDLISLVTASHPDTATCLSSTS